MTTQAVSPDLRYPIGPFKADAPLLESQRAVMIQDIADLPKHLRAAVAGLNDEQLDLPYREGGWTARQIVHHLVDSHVNSYIRMRFALTENNPTIIPYNEAVWAELTDAKHAPIELSLQILDGLHARWAMLLRSMKPEDWKRTMVHPDRGQLDMNMQLAIYAWHSKHHTAHITELRKRNGW